MKRWIGSLVSAGRKPPQVVEPPAPPMPGPSGQPAGIDHLMAQSRFEPEPTDDAAEAGDPYAELMPVRRLTNSGPLPLEADAATAPLPPPALAFDPEQESAPVEVLEREAPSATTATASEEPASTAEEPASTAEEPARKAVGSAGTAEEPADIAEEFTGTAEEPAGKAELPPFKAPPATWETLQALARMANDQRDFEAAAGWWRLMRLGFPHVFHGHAEGAMALVELGRLDEARQLLTDAGRDFPNEPAFAVTRGQLEARAGDWGASVQAWRSAMQFAASPWWACTKLVEALEQAGASLDEIDAVLAQGCRDARFRTPAVLTKAITVAFQRQDWMELAERLTILGNASSEDEMLGRELGAVLVPLRNANPEALAAVVKEAWVSRAIDSPQTEPRRLILQARLAQLAGRRADVMAKLAALRPVMPLTVEAYLRVESILRDAGFPDAADAALLEAADRLPPDPAIWIRIGDTKEARDDWAGAVAHWTSMASVFPDVPVAVARLSTASQRLHPDSPSELEATVLAGEP